MAPPAKKAKTTHEFPRGGQTALQVHPCIQCHQAFVTLNELEGHIGRDHGGIVVPDRPIGDSSSELTSQGREVLVKDEKDKQGKGVQNDEVKQDSEIKQEDEIKQDNEIKPVDEEDQDDEEDEEDEDDEDDDTPPRLYFGRMPHIFSFGMDFDMDQAMEDYDNGLYHPHLQRTRKQHGE
ncbi:hypothetical protein GGR57DRAFT_499897 [Xylariaceae sp. FL1272]|nr:hypothetical protein GGR57DRAFT_499897 [Xylariaceae sp. FL1272]